MYIKLFSSFLAMQWDEIASDFLWHMPVTDGIVVILRYCADFYT